MEERLNAITIERPESNRRQPPKADTLATLLSQGLQSHDKKILNVSEILLCLNFYNPCIAIVPHDMSALTNNPFPTSI